MLSINPRFSDLTGAPWTTKLLAIYSVAMAIVYLIVVAVLRYRNLRRLRFQHAAHLEDPHSMSYTRAKEIINTTIRLEFPFMFGFSLQWALIKSYGIANGTELLVRTRRLTDERTVGTRSEDTGMFLYELLVTGLDTPRGHAALAKMNWIHARYGASISNGDLIHMLALFVLEPIRYIDNFEWRRLDELEKVALFVYWKEIGNRMGMVGIPETLDELVSWTEAYEKENMVYSPNNTKCYDGAVGLYLGGLPRFLRPVAKSMADSLTENYVRKALGVPDPPVWAPRLVNAIFAARAGIVRYCLLPRFWTPNTVVSSTSGRLQRTRYLYEPWYVKETVWSKLLAFLGLGKIMKIPGPEFLSEGYLPAELGPKEFRSPAALDDVGKQAALLDDYAKQGGAVGAGCPFAFAR